MIPLVGIPGAGAVKDVVKAVKDTASAVKNTVDFMDDPLGYLGQEMQAMDHWLVSNLFSTLLKLVHPDFSSAWFLEAYRVSFAIAFMGMIFLLIKLMLDRARMKISGEQLVNSLAVRAPAWVAGVIFGPSIAAVLLGASGALADGAATWMGTSPAAIIASLVSQIDEASWTNVAGGSLIAIAVFFLVGISFALVFLTMLGLLVAQYFLGVIFPIAWVWMIDPRQRHRSSRAIVLFIGFMLSPAAIFFALGFAYRMIGGLTMSIGDGFMQTVVNLMVAFMAMVLATTAPFMLIKFMPLGLDGLIDEGQTYDPKAMKFGGPGDKAGSSEKSGTAEESSKSMMEQADSESLTAGETGSLMKRLQDKLPGEGSDPKSGDPKPGDPQSPTPGNPLGGVGKGAGEAGGGVAGEAGAAAAGETALDAVAPEVGIPLAAATAAAGAAEQAGKTATETAGKGAEATTKSAQGNGEKTTGSATPGTTADGHAIKEGAALASKAEPEGSDAGAKASSTEQGASAGSPSTATQETAGQGSTSSESESTSNSSTPDGSSTQAEENTETSTSMGLDGGTSATESDSSALSLANSADSQQAADLPDGTEYGSGDQDEPTLQIPMALSDSSDPSASNAATENDGGSTGGESFAGGSTSGESFAGGSTSGETFDGGSTGGEGLMASETSSSTGGSFDGGSTSTSGETFAGGGTSTGGESFSGGGTGGESFAGGGTSGETFAGGGTSGETFAGGGTSTGGESFAGGSTSGESFAGGSTSGETFDGGSTSGESFAGGSTSGESFDGGGTGGEGLMASETSSSTGGSFDGGSTSTSGETFDGGSTSGETTGAESFVAQESSGSRSPGDDAFSGSGYAPDPGYSHGGGEEAPQPSASAPQPSEPQPSEVRETTESSESSRMAEESSGSWRERLGGVVSGVAGAGLAQSREHAQRSARHMTRSQPNEYADRDPYRGGRR